MIKTHFRRFVALAATTALAASLAACGHQNTQQSQAPASLAAAPAAQPGWSMNDLAGVDPAYLASKAAPLPQAVPMKASYHGSYSSAPAYDYGPQPYDGGYAGDVGPDDYRWLALASSLGGMLGDAPPDYGFAYDGVQPWAWETGDRYVRYAEPIDGGYRYYYYAPDSERPFLISDPYYSYGYQGDQLVTIYDRSGRVIDSRRAARERRAAQNYYARAEQMYQAAHRERRLAVAASLWDRHRAEIAAQQRQWVQARRQRPAWQGWDAQNEQRLHRDWASEALVRREAERSFAGWQKADFRTPAPRFYSPRQRQAQLQKVAAIRRTPQFAAQQRQRELALQRQAQQQRVAQQHAVQRTQLARREDTLRRQQQQQTRTQGVAQQRVAQAQRTKALQAQRIGPQRQAQAQRLAAQQQAQQHRVAAQQQAAQRHQQQASRVAAQSRAQAQQAAHAHRQQAQRAAQQHQQQAQQRKAQQRKGQQRQARAVQQQRQDQAQHVARQHQQQASRQAAQRREQAQATARAHQQQAQQRKGRQRQAQQRQAQQRQARAAQQQRQGHAQQAARQRQAQSRQTAQRQRQAQAQHADRQRQAQARQASQHKAHAAQQSRKDHKGNGPRSGHG